MFRLIFIFETIAHEWTVSYSNHNSVSKHLNDYKNRKFYFNNDADYKNLTSYEAAAKTCGSKLVANFKTHFTVQKVKNGRFKVRVPGRKKKFSEERKVYDESTENIKSVVVALWLNFRSFLYCIYFLNFY